MNNDNPKNKFLKSGILLFVLILLNLLIRIPFLPQKIDFNNDAPVYSSAIQKQFLSGNYAVQPPGYISYIYLGRLIYLFIHDPVVVQHIINILLVILIDISIFALLLKLNFTRFQSFLLALFFSTNNIMMIGSMVGGNRLFLVLASIILIYFSISIIRDKKISDLIVFTILFSFFLGFRQDLAYIFMPFFIFLCYRVRKLSTILVSLFLFLIICLSWLIPLVLEYGGISAYVSRLFYQSDSTIKTTSLLFSGFTIITCLNIIRTFSFCLNAFAFCLILFISLQISKIWKIEKYILLILLFVFVPSFFFIIFIHNGNYVLLSSVLVPLFLFFVSGFKSDTKAPIIAIYLGILLQIVLFFGIKLIENPGYIGKIANTILLQYSYDGIKSAQLRTFRSVLDDSK
jgi:hypothetical protein